jgi:hypothetical protein
VKRQTRPLILGRRWTGRGSGVHPVRPGRSRSIPGKRSENGAKRRFLIVLGLAALAQAQTFTTLYNFSFGSDGGAPFAGVIQDTAPFTAHCFNS